MQAVLMASRRSVMLMVSPCRLYPARQHVVDDVLQLFKRGLSEVMMMTVAQAGGFFGMMGPCLCRGCRRATTNPFFTFQHSVNGVQCH